MQKERVREKEREKMEREKRIEKYTSIVMSLKYIAVDCISIFFMYFYVFIAHLSLSRTFAYFRVSHGRNEFKKLWLNGIAFSIVIN